MPWRHKRKSAVSKYDVRSSCVGRRSASPARPERSGSSKSKAASSFSSRSRVASVCTSLFYPGSHGEMSIPSAASRSRIIAGSMLSGGQW